VGGARRHARQSLTVDMPDDDPQASKTVDELRQAALRVFDAIVPRTSTNPRASSAADVLSGRDIERRAGMNGGPSTTHQMGMGNGGRRDDMGTRGRNRDMAARGRRATRAWDRDVRHGLHSRSGSQAIAVVPPERWARWKMNRPTMVAILVMYIAVIATDVPLVAMARRLNVRAVLDRHWRSVFFACFVILVVAVSATQIEQYHITKDGQREGAERRDRRDRSAGTCLVRHGVRERLEEEPRRVACRDRRHRGLHRPCRNRHALGTFTAKLRQIVEDKAPKVNCDYPPPSVSTTTTTTEKP
jgi:hypothetical protein